MIEELLNHVKDNLELGITIPAHTKFFPELGTIPEEKVSPEKALEALSRCKIEESSFGDGTPCISLVYDAEDQQIGFIIAKLLRERSPYIVTHCFRLPKGISVELEGDSDVPNLVFTRK